MTVRSSIVLAGLAVIVVNMAVIGGVRLVAGFSPIDIIGFSSVSCRRRTSLSGPPSPMRMMIPIDNDVVVEQVPSAVVFTAQQQTTMSLSSLSSPLLEDGIQHFLSSSSSSKSLESVTSSNSLLLSLKDRPPPPTAEEIAAKKRNFNLWFWGGGFVAPFLATFYYFGFKFWEK